MAENDFRFVLDMIPERWSDFEFGQIMLSARKSGKTDSDEKNVTRYAIGEGDETDCVL